MAGPDRGRLRVLVLSHLYPRPDAPALGSFIHQGVVVTEGILNRVEMAFRPYDPCFGCATHALPGEMPLVLTVRDAQGTVVRRVRNC